MANQIKRYELFLRVILILLALVCTSLNTAIATPTTEKASLSFQSAYKIEPRLYWFSPIGEYDWEKTLPQKIIDMVKTKNSTDTLNHLNTLKNMWGDSIVKYTAEVDPALKGLFYYLITTDGVCKLEPSHIEGIARFEWARPKGDTIRDVTYYGYIIGNAACPNDPEGALVIFSDKELEFHVSPFEPDKGTSFDATPSGNDITYTYSKGENTFTLTIGNEYSSKIISSYRFTIDDDDKEYIFIKWGDFGCGLRNYSLFESDNGLEELRRIRDKCDL